MKLDRQATGGQTSGPSPSAYGWQPGPLAFPSSPSRDKGQLTSGRSRALFACACPVAALVVAPMAGAVPVSPASRAAPAGLAPATARYESTVLSNKPALYWRLGEASGTTAADASGHERTGTYHGSPILGLPGANGQDSDTQVKFNDGAAQDWVGWNTGSHTYRGLFSFEAWVTPSVGSGEQDFVSTRWKQDDATFDAKFSDLEAHGLRIDVGNGSESYVSKTLPFGWLKDQTYYIAIVVAAERVTVYVNGLPLGYASYGCGSSCQLPLLYSAHEQLQVGRDSTYDEWFHGDIDEVAVYHHRLSASQVAAHYRAGRYLAPLHPRRWPPATASSPLTECAAELRCKCDVFAQSRRHHGRRRPAWVSLDAARRHAGALADR